MLMLIDTRDRWERPPPLGPRPPDEPPREHARIRLPRAALQLMIGLALVLLSSAFPPILAYVLLIAACVCIGRGLGTMTRSTSGLNEYRQ